jgi:hypothetical protein
LGLVQQNHDQGFDFLKILCYFSVEDFQAVMKATRDLNMYTAGHIPYAVGLDGVLAEGMDEIAHVEELENEFFDIDRNKQLPPEGWVPYIIQVIQKSIDLSASTALADFERENQSTLERITGQLQDAEVPLDTTLFVTEALSIKMLQPEVFLARPENRYEKTGIVNAARVVEKMTGEGDFGMIEIGNRADLILVSGNPLEDISTIRSPLVVMAYGKWYSAKQLSELIEISGPTKWAKGMV